VHASWLNQVQIYFSIRRRKAISPHDFADLDQLSERFPSFHRYNKTATPFDGRTPATTPTPTCTASTHTTQRMPGQMRA
jgi:hypothetical protein